MSSSRNKRKRADVEVPPPVASPSSRRRTGEGLTGNEPDDSTKNEGGSNISTTGDDAAPSVPEVDTGESTTATDTTTMKETTGSPKLKTPQHTDAATTEKNEETSSAANPLEKNPDSDTNQASQANQTTDTMPKVDAEKPVSNAPPPAGNVGQATQDRPNGGTNAATSRESKIRSMVSHRKFVLDRVRSGRSASRGRVLDIARSEAQAAKLASANRGEASRGNAPVPPKPAPLSEKARDEAEIAAFRKLSRSAMQAAKKQRAESNDGGQEKRNSVSLRRGASVGKKMNAALSSLVPDRSALAPDGTTAGIPVQNANTTLVGEDKGSTLSGVTPLPPPQRVSSTAAARQNINQYTAQPTGKKLNLAQNQAQTQAFKDPADMSSEVTPNLARSGSQKMLKSASLARVASATDVAPLSSQPQHSGLGAPGLPTNRLAHQPAPVICRQAMALREKRDAIKHRLVHMLKKRGTSDNGGVSATSGALAIDYFSEGNLGEYAMSPSKLPDRRKTHWDTLLQEMKWMATDFSEERKWKLSAARTLSSAVQSAEQDDFKGKKKPETETQKENGSEKAMESNEVSQVKEVQATSPPADDDPPADGEAAVGWIRVYTKPTTDDNVSCRTVAQTVADKVRHVGNRIMANASPAVPDQVQLKSVDGEMKEPLEDAVDPNGLETTTLGAKSEEKESKEEEATSSEKEAEKDPKKQTNSFQRISKAVDNILDTFSASPRRPPKRKATSGGKGSGDDFTLTSNQLETIEFIEKNWGHSKNGAGAILSGPKSSGKTTAVCSLLWKQLGSGPQLLVCSPYRVMKWTHELKSFKPLRVSRYCGTGETSSSDSKRSGLGAKDVVVCDYSGLLKLKEEDFCKFQTVIIDSRYSQGFLGSRWPSTFDGKVGENLPLMALVPPELICETWWEHLVEMMSKSSFNCILIENPGPSVFVADAIEKSEMQRVELIALRAAFILGAHLFASPSSSVKKRILTWARRRTKETMKSTTNNKVKDVQEFFLRLMNPFSFHASGHGQLDQLSHKAGKRLDLEVRPCHLSDLNKTEYERRCKALRGALSLMINDANGNNNDIISQNHRVIADSLLCLRRHCFHSNMSQLFMNKSFRSRLGKFFPDGSVSFRGQGSSRILCRKILDSSSQSDMDLASEILVGSPKLRELVTILRNECDFRIEGDHAIANFLQQPDKTRRAKNASDPKSSKAPRKVVILAALPEVQIILSVLLNCLGLAHELFLRPSRCFLPTKGEITPDLLDKQQYASTLAWIECQEALSRFNSVPTAKSLGPHNLLVASPEIVAADHGGIGIDLADFVISVDEDWSGRNELIMRSLVAGLIARNLRVKDKGCQLLKLVCENTCEEIFLSAKPDSTGMCLESNSNVTTWPWPLDVFGSFATLVQEVESPSWPEREHSDALFAFPALNLFRFRNQALSEVLGLDSLPQSLQNGSTLLFLPGDSDSESQNVAGEKAAEISLLKHLMETEHSAHTKFHEYGIHTSCPLSFPEIAITSNNFATKLYLHLLQKSLDADSSSEHDVPKEMLTTTTLNASMPSAAQTPPLTFENLDVEEGSPKLGSSAGSAALATTLLLYDAATKDEQPSTESEIKKHSDKPRLQSLRGNKYATGFRTLRHGIQDGNQGVESLVYFPPLFPQLLQCSAQAKHDILAFLENTTKSESKRAADSTGDGAAKRAKIEAEISAAFPPLPATIPPVIDAPHVTSISTDDEASYTDAAKALVDLDEDFGLVGLGAMPLPHEAVAESAKYAVGVSHRSLDPDRILTQNELLEGYLPETADELDVTRASTNTALPSRSIMLFTKRRRQQFAGAPLSYKPAPNVTDFSRPSTSSLSLTDLPAPRPGNGVFQDINGSNASAKKMKKKMVATPVAPSGNTRPVGEVVMPNQAMAQYPINAQVIAKPNDKYHAQLTPFLSARQKAMGLSLFESPPFSFAWLRFRNLLNDRAQNLSWSLSPGQKLGQGLPMISESSQLEYQESSAAHWSAIGQPFKNESSKTGDDAIAVAQSQRSTLRRSLSAPSRVDFGPFNCGFLLSLSGMTGISPPRSRSGVSLPMGVKLPLSREQHQQPWSNEDDLSLREAVQRVGMNWSLVSRLLSGFDDFAHANQALIHQRSARHCRDRWQSLARLDLTLAKDVQSSEKSIRERSNLRAADIGASSNDDAAKENGASESTEEGLLQNFLVPAHWKKHVAQESAADNDKMKVGDIMPLDWNDSSTTNRQIQSTEQDAIMTDIKAAGKKSFGSLLSARSRQKTIPLTIPGVVPGSQPSFVASHPSHHQSVQSSVAATWTNGRTEMWPLQFLDVAEKQRIAMAERTTPKPVAKTSSTSRSQAVPTSAAPGITRQAVPSNSARAPLPSGSRAQPVPSNVRVASSSGTARVALPVNPQRSPPVPSGGRSPPSVPSAVAGSGSSPTAATVAARAPSTARTMPPSNASRGQTNNRPHHAMAPVPNSNAPHGRRQKSAQQVFSPVNYQGHPPSSGQHYAPPHAHPPHAGSPHQQPSYHHHHHVAASPPNRSPRNTTTGAPPSHLPYAVPTPVAQTQGVSPAPAPAPSQPTSPSSAVVASAAQTNIPTTSSSPPKEEAPAASPPQPQIAKPT